MFRKLENVDRGEVPQEGDLFKVMEVGGRSFEIRYGFYEESDRYNGFAEPMEIYPDFRKEPQYTAEGVPFATAMQEPCGHYDGAAEPDSTCADCRYYRQGEELLGLCECPVLQKGEGQ